MGVGKCNIFVVKFSEKRLCEYKVHVKRFGFHFIWGKAETAVVKFNIFPGLITFFLNKISKCKLINALQLKSIFQILYFFWYFSVGGYELK